MVIYDSFLQRAQEMHAHFRSVHATLSVALTKCIKYTQNISKVNYFQFFGCLCYTLETRSRLWMFFVKYLTNRFHVAVHLSSNRSQMTSKCGKNKKVAHEATMRDSSNGSRLPKANFVLGLA